MVIGRQKAGRCFPIQHSHFTLRTFPWLAGVLARENPVFFRQLAESFKVGRLLILSSFSGHEHRVTSVLAMRRDEFAAALTDEIWFAHIAPGGEVPRLAHKIAAQD